MNYYFPKLEEQVRVEQRLINCKKILRDDFMIKLPYCQDMLDLVDKHKVSFQVNQSELTGILEKSGFSMAEQAYIRRTRHQGRNNLAAKRLRKKKRENEFSEELYLDQLRAERDRLGREKEELAKEIESYKNFLIDC